MDKEAVVHIYNGILLSQKKEYIWVSPNEMDEPRVSCTEWSKSEREKQILHTSTYIWNLERRQWGTCLQGSRGQRWDAWTQRQGREERVRNTQLCLNKMGRDEEGSERKLQWASNNTSQRTNTRLGDCFMHTPCYTTNDSVFFNPQWATGFKGKQGQNIHELKVHWVSSERKASLWRERGCSKSWRVQLQMTEGKKHTAQVP